MFGQDNVLCCQDLSESTLDKSYGTLALYAGGAGRAPQL